MTKYSEDGTKILEQILPFFKPEYTTSVNLIDGIPSIDIPLILNSVSVEDAYDSDFETRRVMMWTLSFTMKGFFFGPRRNKRTIKFIDVRLHDNMQTDSLPLEKLTIQPGLTSNSVSTNTIDETIPYDEINFDDDWGIIRIITEGNDDQSN